MGNSKYIILLCIFLLGSTNLAEGTARLNDKNMAEIYHNEKWIPICAHWFWNDNNGATLFCQQLGYEIGIIKQDSMERQVPLSADGFRIGACETNDIWPQCTGGYCTGERSNTRFTIGGDICSDCQSGSMAGLKIKCSGSKGNIFCSRSMIEMKTDS